MSSIPNISPLDVVGNRVVASVEVGSSVVVQNHISPSHISTVQVIKGSHGKEPLVLIPIDDSIYNGIVDSRDLNS